MSYIITTICVGQKYTPILSHWLRRCGEKCPAIPIQVWNEKHLHVANINYGQYAWWDLVRLMNNLSLMNHTKTPVVHCDIDNIIEKDISPLVNLPYDLIISTEIGGTKAFPAECSSKIGFGVCSGFYIIKPSATSFLLELALNMTMRNYDSYSDQVNIMNMIVNTPHTIHEEHMGDYVNKIITVKGITICVLDFQAVIRDPICTKDQYTNHINIDNVGGTENFIQYFYQPLESLPLTCRCGKLGDTNVCTHVRGTDPIPADLS
jgi:hypothetical protein